MERPPYVRLLTIHQAEGLEFPIMITPEVQRNLNQPEQEPSFLVSPEWGLDLNLGPEGVDTRSALFAGEVNQGPRQASRGGDANPLRRGDASAARGRLRGHGVHRSSVQWARRRALFLEG